MSSYTQGNVKAFCEVTKDGNYLHRGSSAIVPGLMLALDALHAQSTAPTCRELLLRGMHVSFLGKVHVGDKIRYTNVMLDDGKIIGGNILCGNKTVVEYKFLNKGGRGAFKCAILDSTVDTPMRSNLDEYFVERYGRDYNGSLDALCCTAMASRALLCVAQGKIDNADRLDGDVMGAYTVLQEKLKPFFAGENERKTKLPAFTKFSVRGCGNDLVDDIDYVLRSLAFDGDRLFGAEIVAGSYQNNRFVSFMDISAELLIASKGALMK